MKGRFIYSDEEQDKWTNGPWAIIGDSVWYEMNEKEITSWCDLCISGWYLQGTVIRFKDRDGLLMFRLTWNE